MSSSPMLPTERSDEDDVFIRVKNLTKVYHVYDKPQDRLKQMIMPRLDRLLGRRETSKYFHEFRVLNDVSFNLRRGETVGVIGHNGAGKSTLLQLICGTLYPTVGEVEVKGRVAALLELGSGFNPEFTGRENIYMNASILGLSTSEIDARFDQIEGFADIGEFIEQPVKTYSSGMYARLAFAVIAHVDADILIVDEALSVGDAVFTQKCMRFIRDFRKKGTLLFVSHDMAAVQNLCNTTIWLANGHVRALGRSKAVAEDYMRESRQQNYGDSVLRQKTGEQSEGDAEPSDRALVDYEGSVEIKDNMEAATGWYTGSAKVLNVGIKRLDGTDAASFQGGERVRLTVQAVANKPIEKPILGFLWRDRLGQDLFGENTLPFTSVRALSVEAGQHFWAHFDFRLPMLPNGQYVVMSSVAEGDLEDHVQHDWLNDALVVTVSSSKIRWGLVGIHFDGIQVGFGDV